MRNDPDRLCSAASTPDRNRERRQKGLREASPALLQCLVRSYSHGSLAPVWALPMAAPPHSVFYPEAREQVSTPVCIQLSESEPTRCVCVGGICSPTKQTQMSEHWGSWRLSVPTRVSQESPPRLAGGKGHCSTPLSPLAPLPSTAGLLERGLPSLRRYPVTPHTLTWEADPILCSE